MDARSAVVLATVWPPMADAVRYYLAWTEYFHVPVSLTSGWRSADEQAALYAEGRTPDEIANHVRKYGRGGAVTDAPPGYSAHNYGLAVDISSPQMALARAIGQQVGFGTVSWDPAHLEWPQWRALVGV